ncbi:MAG: tetratricopeptide repeat protein [Candidatus Hydrogenedentes bacterium]|nr:tetratricopeptide repeat protein [Candidatus Hydrogenedentota bacterium]
MSDTSQEVGAGNLVLRAILWLPRQVSRLWGRTAHKSASRERRSAQPYVRRGIQAYNRKDYDRAEHYFSKAIERDYRYARAYLYLGNSYYKRHREVDAVNAWQRAIVSDPESDAASDAQAKLERMRMHRGQEMNAVIEILQHKEE